MNMTSCDCRRVPDELPGDYRLQVGDFSWGIEGADGTRWLHICLPGETWLVAIKVQRGNPGGDRMWGWDGNEERPTVMPSIHLVGHWHGYLRAGRLESC